MINNTNGSSSGNSGFDEGLRLGAAQRAARGATSASVGKAGSTNQVQSTAEACAKHLKEFIEKGKK